MPIESRPMTVGDLKNAIADLPDEMPLVTYFDDNESYVATHEPYMPSVSEMVGLVFEDPTQEMILLVEDFERRRHWWTKQPTIVRKFTALQL